MYVPVAVAAVVRAMWCETFQFLHIHADGLRKHVLRMYVGGDYVGPGAGWGQGSTGQGEPGQPPWPVDGTGRSARHVVVLLWVRPLPPPRMLRILYLHPSSVGLGRGIGEAWSVWARGERAGRCMAACV